MANSRRSSIWKIAEEELRDIVASSRTMSEVLKRCGTRPVGTAPFTALKTRCQEAGIDLDELRQRSLTKVREGLANVTKPKKPLEEILVENSSFNRGHLKTRLVKEGVIENRCQGCGNSGEWLGKPLSLILDHANGVGDDNRPQNLRLLCPNCNAQTPTFSRKKSRIAAG